MKKVGIWGLLAIYFVLLLIDVGANIIAIFIPAIGGIAESLTEGLIEVTSAIIVIIIAFIK